MDASRRRDNEPFVTPRKMIQWAQALCFALIPAIIAVIYIQGREVRPSDIMAMTTLAAIGTGSHAGLKWVDIRHDGRPPTEVDDEADAPPKRQTRNPVNRRRGDDNDNGLLQRLRHLLTSRPQNLEGHQVDDRGDRRPRSRTHRRIVSAGT